MGCVLNDPGVNNNVSNAGPSFFADETTRTLYLYFTRGLTGRQDTFDIYVSTCTADSVHADPDGKHEGLGKEIENGPDHSGWFQHLLGECNRQQLWSAGSLVPELSSPVRDTRTAIRRDGLEIIISTTRAGGVGSSDLWVSTRGSTLDHWSTPVNLGSTVNSTAFDGAPALSWDGKTLIFYSLRTGPDALGQMPFGNADLYMSTRVRLDDDGSRPREERQRDGH